MLAEKVCNLGFYRLGEQGTRPVAQDFSELILDVRWLNQLDDVIFGHGISLLRWRSGGVKHPHDMPPFRFPPSPTLGDSSRSSAEKRRSREGQRSTFARFLGLFDFRLLQQYPSNSGYRRVTTACPFCAMNGHRAV